MDLPSVAIAGLEMVLGKAPEHRCFSDIPAAVPDAGTNERRQSHFQCVRW